MRLRTRRKGGKFIKSGTFGCMFNPALKCSGSNTRKKGYITKAIVEEDAAKEWKYTAVPRRLNTAFQYFIYPNKQCKPGEIDASDEYGKCHVNADKAILLQSPYGGTDLDDIRVPLSEIPALYAGFVNIFDGLALLHSEKIAHKDIKPPNILGLRRDDGSYHLRLIDFGISRPFPHLMKYVNTVNYAYWPYEIRLLDPNFTPTKADIDEFMSRIQWANFPDWLYRKPNRDNKITVDMAQAMQQRIQSGGEAVKEQIIVASDVFALGRTLGEVWTQQTSYVFDDGGVVVKIKPHYPYIKHDASLALFDLVANMCNLNPFARITLEEAKARFIALLPIINDCIVDAVTHDSAVPPVKRARTPHKKGYI